MLAFRKILLHDKIYYYLLIVILLITAIRLIIPKHSNFKETSNSFTGIIVKIVNRDDYKTIYIKQKETIITTLPSSNKIHLGEKIRLKGKFQRISKNTIPNSFNYQDYCYQRNIFYQVKATSFQIISSNHSPYYYLKEKLYNHFKYNPYLLTFLLGDKSYIKEEVKTSYQANGISHLFAISGMHITLFSSILERLLRKKKIEEKKRFLIISIILFLYLILVGLSPSMLRGVLFYYLFTLNKLFYFYIKPVNLWIITISIALLINPYYLKDAGFLYSYSISYALLKMGKQLTSKRYLISLLKVSILSFLVSLPITLYFFCQTNLMSIIYNLLFVPLISLIIFPLSMIVGVITVLLPIYEKIIYLLELISLTFTSVKIGIVIFKKESVLLYLLYSVLIILYLHKNNKKILIIIMLLLIIHKVIPIIDYTNWVEVLDVGQGDSTFIHLSNQTLLIDTGGNIEKNQDLATNTLIPFFKSQGINTINTLIISHGDYDHMGEAISLIENFKVEKVIFNCGEFNDLEKELIKVLNKKKILYYSCIKELNVDANKLYFLQTKEYDNENDNSNVIYTEINGYKFLFMGDAGVEKENDILDKYNISNIDVLKVGHHGSKTSSSEDFINEINPNYSIISVGKNNRYGHPNKEVLDTLKDSKIYRTDQDGSIMFKIKNNTLKVETCSP